jgi:hypothetical protein
MQVFFWDQDFFAFCKSSSHHSSGWVPTSSAEISVQEASAGYRTLAIHIRQNEYQPQVSEDAGCKKGQLSQRPPIPYIPLVDIVTPKEEPQVLKVKLPDASHISVPIFSRGNNEEYLVHIVAVLRIIEQKGLPKKCRVLAKAVVKRSKALKNLQEALESQDTVLTSIDITARKLEIEQT